MSQTTLSIDMIWEGDKMGAYAANIIWCMTKPLVIGGVVW